MPGEPVIGIIVVLRGIVEAGPIRIGHDLWWLRRSRSGGGSSCCIIRRRSSSSRFRGSLGIDIVASLEGPHIGNAAPMIEARSKLIDGRCIVIIVVMIDRSMVVERSIRWLLVGIGSRSQTGNIGSFGCRGRLLLLLLLVGGCHGISGSGRQFHHH